MPHCSTIPILIGETASGKSALAIALALRLQSLGHQPVILTADAYQIYKGMDIGTAKPTQAQRDLIPHRLLDLVTPDAAFSAHDWLARAREEIAACAACGQTPLVVGGTHLYVKLLLDGMFEGPPPDPALRAALAALPPQDLRARLERADPASAQKLHPHDLRRTIRALEVLETTGTPLSAWQTQWEASRSDRAGPERLVVIEWPVWLLNRRINARVKAMLDAGWLDERRDLQNRLGPQSREAIGYPQLLAHLRGHMSLADATERIKIATRRLAKSQRTWLRNLRARPGTIVVHPAHDLPGWPWEESSQVSDAQQAALLSWQPHDALVSRVVSSLWPDAPAGPAPG